MLSNMTEMKFSIPEHLIELIKKHPETNWDEIISNAVESYLFNLSNPQSKERDISELTEEIEHSKRLLKLNDNWDGEGSKGYLKPTWEKMVTFLMTLSNEFHDRYGLMIHAPIINPGTEGAIDLHWKEERFELLMSIPENDEIAMNYYGDNYGKSRIKGTLEANDLDIILTFMKMYH